MADLEMDSAAAATSAVINLIESAATSFEVDHLAARDYLLQAFAIIRARKPTFAPGSSRTQGGLIAWQTKRVTAYIDAHINKKIGARELASEVKLSVSHFFRSFKASVGMTPSEYITRKRVAAAQQLMLNTHDSLCQIAIDCGLSDQSHLCRIFRRVVGQTPNAWRRAHATEPPSIGA